ncbi:MAG: trypsin-like peptidase domain-containing protein [Pseudobdellovibrio sp.]
MTTKRIFASLKGLGVVAIALSTLTSCSKEGLNALTYQKGHDSKVSANVIYGDDGRLDLYELTDQHTAGTHSIRSLAESTVALIDNSDLQRVGDFTLIRGTNYGKDYRLCTTEKFYEQDTAAFCSGSLVGPDLIMTAGHCITSAIVCNKTKFIFNYGVKAVGILPAQVSNDEVYSCSQLVRRFQNNYGADYALIKLDRPVLNHRPLAIRTAGEPQVGESLFVIGHPAGLPTKVTLGGKIRSTNEDSYLIASLDTYGGNSGSAVFNSQTGLIEGILVRGENDFVSKNGCYVSNVCTEEGCRGEDVTRISEVRPYIPALPVEEPQPPVEEPTQPPAQEEPQQPPVDEPAPVIETEVFTSQQMIAIPDNSQRGVSSTIQVASLPQGRKVLVSFEIQHSYIGDLIVKLTASNGKTVILHSRTGGNTQNIKKIVDVTAEFGSSTENLDYTLIMQDMARYDRGYLKSWSITLEK